MQQLELLWHLQEIDLRLSELNKELDASPVLAEAIYWEEQVKEKEKCFDEACRELEQKKKELKKKEMKLKELTEEKNNLRKTMYGGEISSTRELEQMEKKLRKLESDQEELEGDVIEELEEIEKKEEEKEEQEKELKQVSATLQEKKQVWSSEENRIREELEKLKQQRAEIEKKVEKPFLEKYQLLSQRYRGKALARVTTDICEGCRVFVSSAIKGRLYNLNTMVYCENCGRILVKLP